MSKIIEARMAKLMAEAQYRYGNDVISIVTFLQHNLRKAIWTANAQFTDATRKVYILLGLAIRTEIQNLKPYYAALTA